MQTCGASEGRSLDENCLFHVGITEKTDQTSHIKKKKTVMGSVFACMASCMRVVWLENRFGRLGLVLFVCFGVFLFIASNWLP